MISARLKTAFPLLLATALTFVTLSSHSVLADEILLNSGVRLEGSVLKRNGETVWLDIGPTVVEISMSDISEITSSKGALEPVKDLADDLFSIAQEPVELSPREHAKTIGPAVIKVGTQRGFALDDMSVRDRMPLIVDDHP